MLWGRGSGQKKGRKRGKVGYPPVPPNGHVDRAGGGDIRVVGSRWAGRGSGAGDMWGWLGLALWACRQCPTAATRQTIRPSGWGTAGGAGSRAKGVMDAWETAAGQAEPGANQVLRLQHNPALEHLTKRRQAGGLVNGAINSCSSMCFMLSPLSCCLVCEFPHRLMPCHAVDGPSSHRPPPHTMFPHNRHASPRARLWS